MAIGLHDSDFKNPVIRWVDSRLPVFTMMQKEYGTFPTPRNFNYFWNFGALAMITLLIMIATGVFLSMNYTAHTTYAFDSVERIMRDVNYGWLLRYVHMNGASMFFIVVYIHIWRGLWYGSYKAPREILWMLGVVIFLLMMATAFLGYVLPWGQMSFWGATVITNLFSAIPLVGEQHRDVALGRLQRGQPDAQPLLQPALPAALRDRRRGLPAHRGAAHHGLEQPARHRPEGPAGHAALPPLLHGQGQRRPDRLLHRLRLPGVLHAELPRPPGQLHPGEPAGDARAHRAGVVLPALLRVLRAVPDKLGGVVLMFGSIAILFVLPWLDTSPVRSMRFRPVARMAYAWLVSFFVADVAARKPAEEPYCTIARSPRLLLRLLPGGAAAAWPPGTPSAAREHPCPSARRGGPARRRGKPMEKA
jgi:ubiquinol-cytochrome c reductase cytochrome b subunit